MSRIRDVDPIFMGSSDVVVQNEGYDGCNKCLDVSEFSVAASNRELVNLENAAVNIDNSNDVIIGPVTQFNVNGNVTIFQNRDCVEEKDIKTPTCNGNQNDIKLSKENRPSQQRNIILCKWICFFIVVTFSVLTVVKLAVLNHPKEPPEEASDVACSCDYKTFNPTDWGEKLKSLMHTTHAPVQYVIIKHTGGDFCLSEIECKRLTKELYLYFNRSNLFYNFLVGGDGNIYVGRGYDYVKQNNSIDIAIHGNFCFDPFYSCMENTTKRIIENGVKEGKIMKNYSVLCHNQTEKVEGPGDNVYARVKTWDHFSNITFF